MDEWLELVEKIKPIVERYDRRDADITIMYTWSPGVARPNVSLHVRKGELRGGCSFSTLDIRLRRGNTDDAVRAMIDAVFEALDRKAREAEGAP